MPWDGEERRKTPMHLQPLAECVERYKTICEKLDGLVERFDKINGRYDSHLVESVTYRAAVEAHTKRFDAAEKQSQWLIGILIGTITTIVLQVVCFAYLWGTLTKRVEINTGIIHDIQEELNTIHPRLPDGRRTS